MTLSKNIPSSCISNTLLFQFVVRNADDGVNFNATMTKFAARLTEFEASSCCDPQQIAQAVDAVFDQVNNAPILLDALVSFAMSKLIVRPDNHVFLKEAVKGYIKANADRPEFKDEHGYLVPAEAPGRRLFSIGRGRNGSIVKRWV
jgi:hypothetical protein